MNYVDFRHKLLALMYIVAIAVILNKKAYFQMECNQPIQCIAPIAILKEEGSVSHLLKKLHRKCKFKYGKHIK